MISFIIPAYNESQVLGRTLEAIHKAAREVDHPYEVIVVDDASTDETAAVAKAGGARVVPVRHRQIAATRNAGARAARGDTLIFVDADTIVTAPTLGASLEALRRGAVGGGATVVLDGRLPWHGLFLVWLIRVAMRIGRLAAGCYLFCTRDAFDAAGGFDEHLFATEELALSRALRRHGRIAILRQTVESSGRKLRTHSGWEILQVFSALISRGSSALRSRNGLDIWYGRRRVDPGTGS